MWPVIEVKQEFDEEQETVSQLMQTKKEESDVAHEEVEPNAQEQPKDAAANDGGDDDFYEEEMMVLVDFDKLLKMDENHNPYSMHIKVIGIDSESPIIQVNDEVYRGTYDYAFGTNVFFERDPESTAALDPVFEKNIKQMYRYVDKTDKVLRMKRIFATAKEDPGEKETVDKELDDASSDDEEGEKYELNMTYEDALNLHLPKGGFPPRHISDQQNGASLVKKPLLSHPKIEKGESSFSK
uniref:Transcription factor TFIIIC triple barrel domain-containing protein n=1 Tax=Anopheles atroparvus TaxID=41427 RepID=A0A182JGJ6_ANOAO